MKYKLSIITGSLLILVTVFSTGCSSTHDTTTTKTTVSESPDYPSTTTKETTTTETKSVETSDDDPDRGLFGIIGNIIALPFRAVGALFSAIF